MLLSVRCDNVTQTGVRTYSRYTCTCRFLITPHAHTHTPTHTRDIQSPVGGDGPGVFQQGWSFTEHGKKAEVKLVNNPYDLEAWSVLVREAQVRT